MAQQTIGIGSAPNDGTGDPIRNAFIKCNDNFTELYAATSGSLALDAEWAPNFTADGDLYIPAVVAMTVDQGNAEIGTGTITYEKSTTAAPSTFSSTTLPATLEAGAWLKVTAASVTGFVATHLVRTA
jgi:hypothetical protein